MNNNMNPIDEFSNNIINESHLSNEILKLNEVSFFKDFVSKEQNKTYQENNIKTDLLKPKKFTNTLNLTKMFTAMTAFVVTVAVVVVALSANARIIKYIFGDDYLSYDIMVTDINEEELFISVSNSYYEEKRIAKEGRNTGFFDKLIPNTYYTLKVEGTSEFGYKTYESVRFKTTYERPSVTITNFNTISHDYSQLITFDYIFSDKYESITNVTLHYKYGYSYLSENQTIDSIIFEDILYFDNISKNYTLSEYMESDNFFKYHLEYFLNGELVISEEKTYIIPIIASNIYVDVFTEILTDKTVLFNGYLENIGSEDLFLNVVNANDEQDQYSFNIADFISEAGQNHESFHSFAISLSNLNEGIIYNFEIKGEQVYYQSWFIINEFYNVDNVEYLNIGNDGNANVIFDFKKETVPIEYNCSFGVDYIYSYGEETISGRNNFINEDYFLSVVFPQGGNLTLKFFQVINGIYQYKDIISIDIPIEVIRISDFEESYVNEIQEISFEFILNDSLNQVSDIKLFYKIIYIEEFEGVSYEEIIFEEELFVANETQKFIFSEYIYGGYVFRFHFEYLLNNVPIINDEGEYLISYIPNVNVYGQISEFDSYLLTGEIFNKSFDEDFILNVFNEQENYEYDLNNYFLLQQGEYEEEFNYFSVDISNLNKDILYNFTVTGKYLYIEDEFMIVSDLEQLYKIENLNLLDLETPNIFNMNVDVVNDDFFNQLSNVQLNYSYETIDNMVSDSTYIYKFISNYLINHDFTYGVKVTINISGEYNNEIIKIDEKIIETQNPNKYYEFNNLNFYYHQEDDRMALINYEFINNDVNAYCDEFGFDYIYTHPEETFSGNIYLIEEYFEELSFPVGGILELKLYQNINGVKEYKDVFTLDIPFKIITIFDIKESYISQEQQVSFEFILTDLLNQVSEIRLVSEIIEFVSNNGVIEEEVIHTGNEIIEPVNQKITFDNYIYGNNLIRFHFEYLLDGVPIIDKQFEELISNMPHVNVYGLTQEVNLFNISGEVFNNSNNENLVLTISNDNENYEYDVNDYITLIQGEGDHRFIMFSVDITNLNRDILYDYEVEGNFVYAKGIFTIESNYTLLYEIDKINIVETTPNTFKLDLDIINNDFFGQVTNLNLYYYYNTVDNIVSDSTPIFHYSLNYPFDYEFTYGGTVNFVITGEYNNSIIHLAEKSFEINNPNKYYEIENLEYYFSEEYEGNANIRFDFINNDINRYCSEFGYDYFYSLSEETLQGNVWITENYIEELNLPVGGNLDIKFYQIINDVKEYKDEFHLDILSEIVVFNFQNIVNSQDNVTSTFTVYNIFNENYYLKIYNFQNIEITSYLISDGFNEFIFWNLLVDSKYTISIVNELGNIITKQDILTLPHGTIADFSEFRIIEEAGETKIGFNYIIVDSQSINPIFKLKYIYTEWDNVKVTIIEVLNNSLEYYKTTRTFEYNTIVEFYLIYESDGLETIVDNEYVNLFQMP